ncbi:MAG: hypothetical protein V3U55_04475, partial [Mycobacterium sp.]
LPPSSAASGGGRGVVGVGATGAEGAEGTVVVGTLVVGTVVAPVRWKSSIASSRITRVPELMTNALEVTMYWNPSLAAVKAPSEEREAGTMSLAPSRTRTPRYWYLPSGLIQIATRAVFVRPKTTAVFGALHRAVEST